MNAWLLLAQLSPDNRSRLFVALGILMGLVVVGGFFILLFRRKLTGQDGAEDEGSVGFSLADLKKMRDRGEITPEEYEYTRQRVIAKVKSSLEGKPAKKRPSPGGDSGSGFPTP